MAVESVTATILGIIMAGIINISLENISLRGGICLVADNSKARFSRFIRL